MPLTEELIQQARERYWRELDRYQKLAEYVHAKCKSIVKDDAIRATTQARAKDPERFAEKLRRYLKDPSKAADLHTVDQIMARVGDLAGVRVATYVEKDRDRVVKAIVASFDGPNCNSQVEVEVKDNNSKSAFYRATHCQVTVKDKELVGTYSNLKGVTCEIQICSLLAHVFNEIEHDLAYKPLSGHIRASESQSLEILGNLTKTGDSVIMQLLAAISERTQSDEEPFGDQYDFVARTRSKFVTSPNFAQHAGQLFDELKSLKLDSLMKLTRELLATGYETRAASLVQRLKEHLARNEDDGVDIDASTSDSLLVLLLDKRLDDVLANHKVGRGYGRAPRIYSVATRFRDMTRPT